MPSEQLLEQQPSVDLPAPETTPTNHLPPPLKWAGGKRWLVPYLRGYLDKHRRRPLVEPFCGGLAVVLGLQPNRAYLNDVNPHLINFYTWVKRGLRIALPLKNDERTYYSYREQFNSLIAERKAHTAEAAGLFYYLNKTGYNGLCRFNRQGTFNVPFGRYRHINYPADFSPYKPIFRRWIFSSRDFGELKLDPQAVVYADPPYDVEFTHYSKDGFSWDDQVRTAEWLARHPGPVVLSNQATPRIRKLYADLGFHLTYLNAPRLISCTGDRTPAREVLACKNI